MFSGGTGSVQVVIAGVEDDAGSGKARQAEWPARFRDAGLAPAEDCFLLWGLVWCKRANKLCRCISTHPSLNDVWLGVLVPQ
jgi:hypothetical protein